MNSRLLFAPWWLHGLIWGAWTALFRIVFDLIPGPTALSGGPLEAAINILVGSVFIGVFMGPFTARANERTVATSGLTDRAEVITAYRASWRGPVPADPRLRDAAYRMTCQRLEQVERQHALNLVVLGLGVLGSIAAMIILSGWWVLLGALLTYAFIRAFRRPYRLNQRMDALIHQGDQ